nr:hypothetical protein Q903MT_gene130 [Picea sitchensis]
MDKVLQRLWHALGGQVHNQSAYPCLCSPNLEKASLIYVISRYSSINDHNYESSYRRHLSL